jgi:hypothetical protein
MARKPPLDYQVGIALNSWILAPSSLSGGAYKWQHRRGPGVRCCSQGVLIEVHVVSILGFVQGTVTSLILRASSTGQPVSGVVQLRGLLG